MSWRQVAFSVMLLLGVLLAGCASRSGVDRAAAAQANADLAAAYLRQNDLELAQRFFTRALDYNNDNLSALWGMAVTQGRIGHPDKARRYYKQALSIERRPTIVNSYAAFVCQEGDVDRAIGLFKQAASSSRYNTPAVALANAGLCLHRAGRDQQAETFYNRALAENASQPMALGQMAKLKYRQRAYRRARAFIERADSVRSLDPEQLKLAARIELAADDPGVARTYIQRYNKTTPGGPITMRQLQRSP